MRAASPIQGLADGLLAPLHGLSALRSPRLWGLAWFPALIGLGWAASSWSAAGFFAQGGILGWLAGIGLMGLVILLQILLALFSPLLDALSARAEGLWSPADSPPAEAIGAGILRALTEGLLLLGWKALLMLMFSPLLLLDAGALVWYPLAGFLIAVDFLDYPLSRRRLPMRARRALFRRQWPAMLGFGAVANLLLLTPGLGGLAFLPVLLGGTWLMLRLLAVQPPPLTTD